MKQFKLIVFLFFNLSLFTSCEALANIQSSSKPSNTQQNTQQNNPIGTNRVDPIQYPVNKDRIPTTAVLPGTRINYEQNPYGTRYKNYIFNNYTVKTETYIQNSVNYTGVSKNLVMDIFTPANDNEVNRPCIIFLYGGGFSMKIDDGLQEICKSMVLRGYVVAAIDYRIGFNGDKVAANCGGNVYNDFLKAELRATQDAIAAIKYIKSNASRLGVNADLIFIGGQSAGAIAALDAVFYDNSETDKNLISSIGGSLDATTANNLKSQSTKVAGVFALSGAISNPKIIENPNNTPTLLVSGTCDELIYSNTGAIYKCDTRAANKSLPFPMIYGPEYIYEKLVNKNNPTFTIKVCKGGHAMNNWGYQKVVDWVAGFTYAVMNNTFKSGTAVVYPDKTVCNEDDCTK